MKFNCDKCALKKHTCCLTGEGPKPADLMVIGQCIEQYQRVLTEYMIWKPIKNVKIGEYVWGYSNSGKLQLTKVLAKYDKGRKKVIQLKNEYNNSLICTPDHPVLGTKYSYGTDKTWMDAEKAVKITTLPFSLNNYSFGKEHKKSYLQGILLGMLRGDGSINHSSFTGLRITFYQNEKNDEVIQLFKHVCNKLNLHYISYKSKSKGFKDSKKANWVYQFTENSTNYISHLRLSNKRTPFLTGFLLGFLVTDGSVSFSNKNHTSLSIKISQKKEKQLTEIKWVLEQLQIPYNTSIYKDITTFNFSYQILFINIKEYSLIDLSKWISKIQLVKLKSIQKINKGRKKVYDITTTLGNFICEGFVVHNCPGPKERELEQIFVGPSGRKLNEGLAGAGVDRGSIYITNAVKGFVVPGKTVNKTSVKKCAGEYLFNEIEEVSPKVILCMGSTAASALGYRLVANSHFYDSTYNCYIVLTHHPAKLLRTNDDKIHDEFMNSFILAASLLEKVQSGEVGIKTEILHELTLDKLNKLGNPISLDLETGGLDFTINPIVSVGLSDGKTTYGIPVYNNENKQILKDKLEILKQFLVGKDIIGHNLKFDYKFLKRNGVSINPYFDTMLAHFLIDREALHGLAELSLKYLHTNLSKGTIDFDKDFKEGTIDVEKYSEYVANDAWMTYKLYEQFKPLMDKEYPKVFYTVMIPTLEWLANAEERGVKVDRKYVEEYINEAKYDLIALEKEIQEDVTVKEFCLKYGLSNFNIRSPKQVADLLYTHLHLQSKIKKTGEEILKELAGKYPQHIFLQKIVDYRHLFKSYRTYLQNLIKFSEADGRIHCTYNQCRVPSGRLASAKPNLQNIPKDDSDNAMKQKQAKIIRRSFVADTGYTLLEADFSQAEFRALAHYSRDPYMIDMINADKDIHKMIASVSYLKPEDQVTPAERKIAKTIVFGIMYGRGAKSIAESLQISFKEAENIRNTFLGTFKQADKWISGVQNFVKKTGYVKTLTGRKITLPAVYSKDKEQVAYASRCAVNYPIQGVVGDMTNLSGALVHQEFKKQGLDAHLIMNIHDSIIVECKEDIADNVKVLMKDVMENKVREVIGLRVNISVDIKAGKNLAFDK